MFLAIKKYPIIFMFAIFTAGFLSYLGHWQYEKGYQRTVSDKARAENLSKKIVALNKLQNESVLEDGLKVIAEGKFNSNMTIFHDNRLNLGQSGYHVYSVFTKTDGQSILVNRGWVKMNLDRRVLPSVSTNENVIKIQGIIRFPVKGVYTLEDEVASKQFPVRVQTIEVDQLSELTNYDLQKYSVLLDESVTGTHFYREWNDLLPGRYMSANKHFAYSLQWYLLALVGLVIFMILIYKMAKNDTK